MGNPTDANTPAFLRRLKGEYGGPGERQSVQIARPKKQLIDTEDDAPTYVDENHETISKEDYEKLNRGEHDEAVDEATSGPAKKGSEGPTQQEPLRSETEPKANIGNSKKRKAVKVIGNEDEVDQTASKTDSVAETKAQPKVDGNESVQSQAKKPKAAKKGKKIKLSFDDDQT